MGYEHEAETVWRAQELYCVDRLSFDAVAKAVGVASSTLKRWSEKYDWRKKREEIAEAEAGIRANKIMARSKVIKALLDNPRADLAFAVSALENQALKGAEAARKGELIAANKQAQSITINTPADGIAALKKAVEQKLLWLLQRSENVDLRAVQDVGKSFDLIKQLEAAEALNKTEGTGGDGGGLGADLVEKLKKAMGETQGF